MLRHVGKVSSGEATGVAKTARAMATLPGLGESYRAGQVGVDQMRLVGKINANPRVAEFVADHDDWFRESATGMPFRDFELVARQWERLVDVDGARDRNERNHDARDFRHRQEPFDLSWSTQGHFGALQGASIDEILKRYEQAEWEADWEKARAEYGDDAAVAHLPRTPTPNAAPTPSGNSSKTPPQPPAAPSPSATSTTSSGQPTRSSRCSTNSTAATPHRSTPTCTAAKPSTAYRSNPPKPPPPRLHAHVARARRRHARPSSTSPTPDSSPA